MDCQRFNIDSSEIYKRLMPYFYLFNNELAEDKTKAIAWIEVMGSMMQNTQDNLFELCKELKAFLQVQGFHLTLVEYLNDLYDEDLRRIDIIENNTTTVFSEAWYLDASNDPQEKVWYLDAENDPDTKVWYLPDEYSGGFNFTVAFPSGLAFDEAAVRAALDPYILAGKTYNIINL